MRTKTQPTEQPKSALLLKSKHETLYLVIAERDRLKAERDALLEVLNCLSLGISEDSDDYPDGSLHRQTMDNLEKARAAITKAEGKEAE